MKKLDKKDLPKLIALVVLSVAVFGYAAVTIFAPPQTNAATKAPGAGTEQAATGAQDPAATPAGAGADATGYDAADIAILTSGKDPFVPNGPAAVDRDAVTASRPTPPLAPLPQVPALPAPGVRRNVAGGPPNWSGPRVASNYDPMPSPLPAPSMGASVPMPTVKVAPPPPPPPPAYIVTGIVQGETDVAILRGGDGGEERRFVRVGDPVGNGFEVAAIYSNGVEIRSGGRRILLKLGDDSRAK